MESLPFLARGGNVSNHKAQNPTQADREAGMGLYPVSIEKIKK